MMKMIKIILGSLLVQQLFLQCVATQEDGTTNGSDEKRRRLGYNYYYYNDDYSNYNYDDYHYYDSSAGKKSKAHGKKSKKSKKGSKKSKKGHHDSELHDDFFVDDFFIGPDRPTIYAYADIFTYPAMVSIAPSGGVSSDVGTVYPFNEWARSVQNTNVDEIEFVFDKESVYVWIQLDGLCTRTGTSDNTVQGYCHFTYSMYDPMSVALLGSFVAEGLLTDDTMAPAGLPDSNCGTMAVTGGTNMFIGVTGLVTICPMVNDVVGFPISAKTGTDIFEGVDGYVHSIYLSVDEEFYYLYYSTSIVN